MYLLKKSGDYKPKILSIRYRTYDTYVHHPTGLTKSRETVWEGLHPNALYEMVHGYDEYMVTRASLSDLQCPFGGIVFFKNSIDIKGDVYTTFETLVYLDAIYEDGTSETRQIIGIYGKEYVRNSEWEQEILKKAEDVDYYRQDKWFEDFVEIEPCHPFPF